MAQSCQSEVTRPNASNPVFTNGIDEYYGQMAALQRAQLSNGCAPTTTHSLPFTVADQLSRFAAAQLQFNKMAKSADSPDSDASLSRCGIFPSLGDTLAQNNEELHRNAPTPPAVASLPTVLSSAENGSRTPIAASYSQAGSPDLLRSTLLLVPSADSAKPRPMFVCTINGTLRHGQQLHLVTSHGQIFSSTVAQINLGLDSPFGLANEQHPVGRMARPKFVPEMGPHSSAAMTSSPPASLASPLQVKEEVASSADDKSSNSSAFDCQQGSDGQEVLEKSTCQSFPKGRLSSSSSETTNEPEKHSLDCINLEEIKEFAKAFKMKRLSLGLTQTQVGQALSMTEGPAYSQSAICRFEKLDITPKSAQKIKPVLEKWMSEIDEKISSGHITPGFVGATRLPPPVTQVMPMGLLGEQNVLPMVQLAPTPVKAPSPTAQQQQQQQPVACSMLGLDMGKKRKRRTSFTPQALEILNRFFERNTHPTGAEMTALAESLNYDREVVRVWFCNKRQALKNTIKKLKHVDYAQCCAD